MLVTGMLVTRDVLGAGGCAGAAPAAAARTFRSGFRAAASVLQGVCFHLQEAESKK